MNKCKQLCDEYSEMFLPGLGKLKDFELEVQFKKDTKLKFCKHKAVSFVIQYDLSCAYDASIKNRVWKSYKFNSYGTPVVHKRKPVKLEQPRKIRMCDDHSVTLNSQLEPHLHSIPIPE